MNNDERMEIALGYNKWLMANKIEDSSNNLLAFLDVKGYLANKSDIGFYKDQIKSLKERIRRMEREKSPKFVNKQYDIQGIMVTPSSMKMYPNIPMFAQLTVDRYGSTMSIGSEYNDMQFVIPFDEILEDING